MLGRNAFWWFMHRLGFWRANTQLTYAEQQCLARHAAGRRNIVELGVMHAATTALLRNVMALDGKVTGIDPHLPGRFGVSFDRWIALNEVSRIRRGECELLRKKSHEAVTEWHEAMDFLFIDADHSWSAIDRDWRQWSCLLVAGGIVALHDSRSVPWREDLESVRYTQNVILCDPRFQVLEVVDSLTVLERAGLGG
jgi:predicted O-methyltransferase YrrM